MTAPTRHDDEGPASSGSAAGEPVEAEEPVAAAPVPGRARAVTIPRIAGIGPFSIRARISSPVLQGLLALAVYLAVWVVSKAYPLVLHPARPQVNQSSMDPNFYTWSLRWWPYAIAHGLNPLHSIEIGAPAGYGLLAGGFINSAITPRTDLPAPVAALAHATPRKIRLFRSFLTRARVTAILVEAASAPGWAGIFSKLGLHGTSIGGVILYKTTGSLTAHDVAGRPATGQRS